MLDEALMYHYSYITVLTEVCFALLVDLIKSEPISTMPLFIDSQGVFLANFIMMVNWLKYCSA